MPQDIIDVHCHCYTGRRDAETIVQGLEALRRAGLRNMVVVGLVNTHLDAQDMWNLVPSFVENRGDPLFHEAEELLELTRLTGPLLIPLVDTRHLYGDVSSALQGYMRQGFRGIKGIYLVDNENDLGIGNVPDTFGITLAEYHRREWEIFAFAQEHDLPVLYHMDARRYGDTMKAILDDFPGIRVDFAHFGIGRSAFRKILDRYDNVYTDISSMLPFMRENPSNYRDFIMHYPDRVCFGSDALLYNTGIVFDYIALVRELALPEHIENQLFSGNAAKFLGRVLAAADKCVTAQVQSGSV